MERVAYRFSIMTALRLPRDLGDYRVIPAGGAGNAISPARRSLPVDEADVGRVYATVRDGTPRRLLDFLIDHPDERFDGAALMRQLELERHDEVARGFTALAADLAKHGVARPWNEAQAGYLLPAQVAADLARARAERPQERGAGDS